MLKTACLTCRSAVGRISGRPPLLNDAVDLRILVISLLFYIGNYLYLSRIIKSQLAIVTIFFRVDNDMSFFMAGRP